ncbi:serine/arginine repetitive matrix protein 1-like [Eriocheir sinensis]|uniref:serine/arginine repetitive matrix protein 1-like n=1 Tax=Eriocheir sinensis TaxID=95602 RepID=UPI0021C90F6B|nr:serine/arginine repetitive matrix protein 1-like [Eriocheir sinensis]
MSVLLTEADMEVSELLAESERREFCPIGREDAQTGGRASSPHRDGRSESEPNTESETVVRSASSSSDLEDEKDSEVPSWEPQRNFPRLWDSLTRRGRVTAKSHEEASENPPANFQSSGAAEPPTRTLGAARSTAPTIVSVTPKLRGSGSPAVSGRRGRTTPPEACPRRRPLSPRDPPGDTLSVSLLKLLSPLGDSPPREQLTPPPDSPPSGSRPSTPPVTHPSQAEPTAPTDGLMRGGRPLAGVLKTSRDHSREARRSLRVSWGDLPEDLDDNDDKKDDDSPEYPAPTFPLEERGYRVTRL